VTENNNISDKPDVHSVLAAIKAMVRKETKARFSESASDVTPAPENTPARKEPSLHAAPVSAPKKPPEFVPNLPSKIYILLPHMRVDEPKEHPFVEPEILQDDAEIPYDTPISVSESFAIANADVDEDMVRDIVRAEVREQLSGELGRALVESIKQELMIAVKKDLIKALE